MRKLSERFDAVCARAGFWGNVCVRVRTAWRARQGITIEDLSEHWRTEFDAMGRDK